MKHESVLSYQDRKELIRRAVKNGGYDLLVTITEQAILTKLAEMAQPLFWYRPRSDGLYEGPIHNAQIESVRKESGAWVPLHAHPPTLSALLEAAEKVIHWWDGFAGTEPYRAVLESAEWSEFRALRAAIEAHKKGQA